MGKGWAGAGGHRTQGHGQLLAPGHQGHVAPLPCQACLPQGKGVVPRGHLLHRSPVPAHATASPPLVHGLQMTDIKAGHLCSWYVKLSRSALRNAARALGGRDMMSQHRHCPNLQTCYHALWVAGLRQGDLTSSWLQRTQLGQGPGLLPEVVLQFTFIMSASPCHQKLLWLSLLNSCLQPSDRAYMAEGLKRRALQQSCMPSREDFSSCAALAFCCGVPNGACVTTDRLHLSCRICGRPGPGHVCKPFASRGPLGMTTLMPGMWV